MPASLALQTISDLTSRRGGRPLLERPPLARGDPSADGSQPAVDGSFRTTLPRTLAWGTGPFAASVLLPGCARGAGKPLLPGVIYPPLTARAILSRCRRRKAGSQSMWHPRPRIARVDSDCRLSRVHAQIGSPTSTKINAEAGR